MSKDPKKGKALLSKLDKPAGRANSKSDENVNTEGKKKHKLRKAEEKPCDKLTNETDGQTDGRTGAAGDAEKEKVHSANDWEHADLGDETRNGKFLKLLGAKKSDHRGKVVIGDHVQNQHKNPDPDKLTTDLETQFEQGLEHKLKSGRGHIGLGFSDPPSEAEKTSLDSKPSDPDESTSEGTEVQMSLTEEPPPKKKFLGFVKSSD